MGKNKLKKFADMNTFECVFQYPYGRLQTEPFPLKGKWHEHFGNQNPIVLELGCGKGEYSVGLGRRYQDKNFIGIDVKGARMWTGAKQAVEEGMTNVAFLRTSIELLAEFFAPGEVSEIWITFPDPQMKKTRKRLTSTRFLKLYSSVMQSNGVVHLKTDSPFLYTYTDALVKENKFETITNESDLYHSGIVDDILNIKTYYEQQWLKRGLTIKYISFYLPAIEGDYIEPDIEIEEDTYRSFSRGEIQCQHLLDDDDVTNN